MKKNLVVISAPSGAGKSTICRKLQHRMPAFDFSISYTTRPKRPYEKDGYDYYFISEEKFNQKVKLGELVEYEEVHGYLYGTSKNTLQECIEKNETILLEVDVKGGVAVKKAFPNNTLTIFIKPPSFEELRRRLKKRGSDSDARIEKRLERVKFEMEYEKEYDYSVVNDDLDSTVKEIIQILENS